MTYEMTPELWAKMDWFEKVYHKLMRSAAKQAGGKFNFRQDLFLLNGKTYGIEFRQSNMLNKSEEEPLKGFLGLWSDKTKDKLIINYEYKSDKEFTLIIKEE